MNLPKQPQTIHAYNRPSMMKYLLDTCVISDFIQGHANVQAHIKAQYPKHLAISALTLMEIQYGLTLNPKRAKKIAGVMQALLELLTIIPYDQQSTQSTAALRAQLKRQNLRLETYDALLAGCAQSHQLILVTSNVAAFANIKGLVVENWREA